MATALAIMALIEVKVTRLNKRAFLSTGLYMQLMDDLLPAALGSAVIQLDDSAITTNSICEGMSKLKSPSQIDTMDSCRISFDAPLTTKSIDFSDSDVISTRTIKDSDNSDRINDSNDSSYDNSSSYSTNCFSSAKFSSTISDASSSCNSSSSSSSSSSSRSVSSSSSNNISSLGISSISSTADESSSERAFISGISLAESYMGYELTPSQVRVLRLVLFDNKKLLLGAPTNWGKSNIITVLGIFSAHSILGWGGKCILCLVPNSLVLLTVVKIVKELKAFSFCSPGYGNDEYMQSEDSLRSKSVMNIWTFARLSSFFQGQLQKSPLTIECVRDRILLFQQSVSCTVIDEAHCLIYDKFPESLVVPRLLNDVSIV